MASYRPGSQAIFLRRMKSGAEVGGDLSFSMFMYVTVYSFGIVQFADTRVFGVLYSSSVRFGTHIKYLNKSENVTTPNARQEFRS